MTPEEIIRNPKRIYQPPPLDLEDDPYPDDLPSRPRHSPWLPVALWASVAIVAATLLAIALP